MMTVVSSSLTTSLFIISRTVCSVRNTTKKQNSFHFVVSKKINNEEHTHAPQLCVVTFFFDFGTESRRLWGRSTSKTKEINKRWIVVELSFYWRSYSTTTRLYIYIYIYVVVVPGCVHTYMPSWYIYMCVPVITRY
jgi:hypothetical protein